MNQFDDKIEQEVYACGSDTLDHELMQNARNNFIRKVYAILGLQLLVTCGFVILSTFNLAFQQFQN
jgi:FtsH-binding integral membrane protein